MCKAFNSLEKDLIVFSGTVVLAYEGVRSFSTTQARICQVSAVAVIALKN